MFTSLLLMAIITAGGLFATYAVANDRSLMWRVAAGCIAGSALFGLLLLLLASAVGMSVGVVIAAAVLTLSPAALLMNKGVKSRFDRDVDSAKGKMQGTNSKKVASVIYFVSFFLLFYLFFDRVYYEVGGAVHTGASQNYGDLPFHLGAIYSFTEINNFPPMNPSYAGAKFTYPFIADLVTAGFVMLGGGMRAALLVTNLAWVFSLLVLLVQFIHDLTASRRAGRIAGALLFLSGGLGFAWFLNDYWQAGRPFLDFLNKMPRDYTISDTFRWGNSLVVLFVTQRGLLLGLPLTLLVLGWLWRTFTVSDEELERPTHAGLKYPYVPLIIGGFAGMLPLVHMHSLAVLFVVTGFLLFFRLDRLKYWLLFGAGVCITAVPELIWSMSGTATDAVKFLAWHFGWDKRSDNVLWFWFKNTGLVFPLLIAGIVLTVMRMRAKGDDEALAKDRSAARSLLLFYVPFAAFFIISNVVKLAPWEWDNIKVLIYWFVGSLPFIAIVIDKALSEKHIFKALGVAAIVILTASGFLDVWRTATSQVDMRVFEPEAAKLAEQIKKKVDPNALIVNAPTFKSAIVLSGRQSLMRYSGHLSSHGINYGEREADVKQIYQSAATADALLKKYDVDYVLVSPDETSTMNVNQASFQKYPIAAEAGQFKLYKVK